MVRATVQVVKDGAVLSDEQQHKLSGYYVWGGSYGGNCNSDGSLNNQGADANYWSQSENSADNGFNLNLNSDGNVNPQNWNNKNNGFTLRCVR